MVTTHQGNPRRVARPCPRPAHRIDGQGRVAVSGISRDLQSDRSNRSISGPETADRNGRIVPHYPSEGSHKKAPRPQCLAMTLALPTRDIDPSSPVPNLGSRYWAPQSLRLD